MAPKDEERLNQLAVRTYLSGTQGPKMTSEDEEEVSDLVTYCNKLYNVTGLSDSERIEIVNAIGLPKGHWFKCKNGHLYCIGECGGAMETGKCPECHATIGGGSHALLSDNQFASEMDGAEHPAWSEAANMANYNF